MSSCHNSHGAYCAQPPKKDVDHKKVDEEVKEVVDGKETKEVQNTIEEKTSTGGKIIRSANRNIKMNRLAKKFAVEIVDEIDEEIGDKGEKALKYLGNHIGCLNQKIGEGKIDIDVYLLSTQKLEQLLDRTKDVNIPEDKLKEFFAVLEGEINDCIE